MQQRSVFGWLLAGAFCAAVSCGGGSNSSTPQGFGVPCTSNKACTTYDLLCGTDGKCVECRGDGDCGVEEICLKGLCQSQDECSDSRDCKGELVCDEDAGVCVECVSSRDCATGEKCADHACTERPTCEFTSDCPDGLVCDIKLDACVTCRTDDDCGTRRVCEDYECVTPTPTPAGGTHSGGTGSGGKAATAGSGTAGTLTGGNSSGGMSGSPGTGGSVAEGGNGGAGGAPDCGCLLNQACTPDQRCVSPNLVDDLFDCDDEILPISGRKGDWAAGADTGINLMHGFTDPGTGWVDHTCAAWAAGGELTANNPNATFAFIGFRLNVNELDEGLPYDLTSYSGLQIKLESSSSVQVVLKTIGGGYFYVTLAPLAGSNLRTASFSSMLKMANSTETILDKRTVYEVQFSVTDPTSFGFAVHNVVLF